MKNCTKRTSLLSILAFAVIILSLTVSAAVPAQAAKKSWKQLYADYLKKIPAQAFPEGKFIYINNDNIPELYLCGSDAATGNRLLVIYNGKLYEHYLDGHGGLMYQKKKNRYHTSGGHMDMYYDTVGKLSKGKMVGTAGGSYGAEDNSNVKYDKNGQPIYKYLWNNKKVSKKTYNAKLKAALGKNTYTSAYTYGKMDTLSKIKKSLS